MYILLCRLQLLISTYETKSIVIMLIGINVGFFNTPINLTF